MGRPTKYTQAIADKIIEAIANGHNRDDAARLAGICPDTLYTWMASKPEFAEECRAADSRAVDVGVSALIKATRSGSVRAIQLWLQSKRPHEWTPSSKVEIANADGQPFLTAGIDLSALSTADVLKLLEIAEKASHDNTTGTDPTDSPTS